MHTKKFFISWLDDQSKMGSVVFAQANGEQITRSEPESVKNPKTTGQNTKRAILATIAKDADLLTPIIDHSFANIKYGADSVRYFRKINLGILRNQVIALVGTNYNLTAKGGLAVPNYLKVSEGSLPAFKMSTDKRAVAFYGSNNAFLAADNITVEDLKYAYPYIQGGDQLTLVKFVKTAGSLIEGDAIFALKYDRIVFAPNAFDDPDVNFFTSGNINRNLLDLTKTTNTSMLSSVDGGAGLGLGFTADTDNTYAAALILSRKVNGKWQRSTQFMELCEFDDAADNAAAIASYGATASVSTQNEYLNQAEQGKGKKGVKGSYAQFYSQLNNTEDALVAVDVVDVDAGSSKAGTVSAHEDDEVMLTVTGFGTADNPVVKCEIQNSDNAVIASGQKYCEYLFKAAPGTFGEYYGTMTFKDGSKAKYDWQVNRYHQVFNHYNSITMHNKKFFISWLDDQSKMGSEVVTGMAGLISELWLLYEDSHVAFNSIRIKVIPYK